MAATALTQEIIDRVRLRIGEPSVGMITDAEVAEFMSLAQRDIIWRLPDAALWCVTTVKETTIVADQEEYTFEAADLAATGFVREISVKWKDNYAKRWEAAHLKKLKSVSELEPSETNPFYTVLTESFYFHVSAATQDNGDVFEVIYIQLPADIDIGGVPVGPEFTRAYFPAIEDFVVGQCWEQRGNPPASEKAMLRYAEKIVQIKGSYEEGVDVARYQQTQER